ncbi:PHD finger protein EHD3 isoform X2 [Andrographis paniculata]|uniref:PHD finger protein EHD3 isoform X2 n=1 Tax=Andrographis paniculata TaxID=175694 RepID=UPI0021E92C8B|nr:PHD finger protein EHD3 isoform X2 [Andrographis paniculata]
MSGEDKETDAFGGGSYVRSGVVMSISDAAKENGNMDVETGSSKFGDSMLTYKRRKNCKAEKVEEDGMVSDGTATKPIKKSTKNSSDQANKKMLHCHTNSSDDCSLKSQRNVVLEQICQSIEIECSLKKRIQDALAFHPGSSSGPIAKESDLACEAGSKGTIDNGSLCNGLENSNNCSRGVHMNHETITELCQGTFLEIIMSENFARLCSLLLGNGIKADKLLDLSCINSRMKEKAYENSPMQFYSDMQEIWTRLREVGTDMISLSKCLSDKTMSSFRGQLESTGHVVFEDVRNETADLIEDNELGEVHTCRQCGEKSDGGNGLVCDSCEEMYHISCIEPAVKEIPTRSWFCANCTAKGIGSPHENCVPCERLNASESHHDGTREDEPMNGEVPVDESSKDLANSEGDDERFQHCKICRTLVGNNEDYMICGHSFCLHKFYHVKCLTSKELQSHAHCWYCPSCLCRTCLYDRDDEHIVLCDGCDHAYHIYCMQPAQLEVPKGKWFCRKCDAAIKRIRKAKHSYEIMQNRYKRRGAEGKVKTDDALDKSGGVDMLLNAAKTLNYEENLAAMGMN